jgi:predicted AlkP superfamily pyrophosphatase or phosphodiesterase
MTTPSIEPPGRDSRPTRPGSGRAGWIPAIGILVSIALIAIACSPGRDQEQNSRPRILLIGIDGASPKVAFPMLKKGLLPHLSKIAADGISGPLRSVLPLYSPRIWNTIATGRRPAEHGIAAFVKSDSKGGKTLYQSSDRRVPSVWNIFSHADRTVGVVNWWTTYPPEKINGVMVSDHFFPEQITMIKKTFKDQNDSLGTLVHPESWSARGLELLADTTPLTDIPDPFAGNEALPHWVGSELLSQFYRTDHEITQVARGLIADYAPDITFVLLPGIDRISHWLWGNLESEDLYPPNLRPTPSEREAGATALRAYYAYTDALIGRLIESYDEDDLILVMSDHGFEAGVSLMLLTGEHDTRAALDGVIFARGKGLAQSKATRGLNVFDIAPTLLAFAGLPIPSDMPGRPAAFIGIGDGAERIATYDDLVIERHAPSPSGREEDIVEHLRALGYLEEESPQADPPKASP